MPFLFFFLFLVWDCVASGMCSATAGVVLWSDVGSATAVGSAVSEPRHRALLEHV